MSGLAATLEVPCSNRRSTIRRSCNLEATCWVGTVGQTRLPARIRTLSTGGLSLRLAQLPEPVPYLCVELVNSRRGLTRRFRVRVLYALPQGREGYVVGGSFLEKLTEEELTSLVS
jgi:hypothetical protein